MSNQSTAATAAPSTIRTRSPFIAQDQFTNAVSSAARSRGHSPAVFASRTAMAQGSQTQTQTAVTTAPTPTTTVLRLRGAHEPRSPRRAVQWAEDVVDNEGLGRKRSKVCCIYHAPKAVGESSSEDDSSSESESDGSDSGVDNGAARMVSGSGKRRTRRHPHDHRHGHGDECGDGGQEKRRPSPNAYERMPKPRGRPHEVKN